MEKLKRRIKYKTTKLYILNFLILFLVSCQLNDENKEFEKIEDLYSQAYDLKFSAPLEARNILFVCDSLNRSGSNDRSFNFKINRALGEIYGAMLNNPDSAEYYYKEAFKYQISKSELADIYNGLGNINNLRNNLDSAEHDYRLALKYADKERDIASINFNIGNIINKKGLKDSSLHYYFNYLEYGKEMNDTQAIVHTYYEIANILFKVVNNPDAVKYYHEAIKYAESGNFNQLLLRSYANLGVAYSVQEKDDSAMIWFRKTLAHKLLNTNPRAEAVSYTNMAQIYSYEEKDDSAKYYFEKSLAVCKAFDIEEGILGNLASLTAIQLEEKKYKEVIKIIAPMLNRMDSISNKTLLRFAYSRLSKAYEGIKDYKQALSYYKRKAHLNDSLKDVTLHRQIIDTEKKYETKLKDQQITYLTQLSEKRKTIQYAVTGILMLVIVLSVFIILWFRSKKMFEEKEKEVIKIKLDSRNRELTSTLLHLSGVQDIGKRVIKELNAIIKNNNKISRGEFNEVFDCVNKIYNDKQWNEFYNRFNELNNDFLKHLTNKYSNLTESEIRICVLLRLNLTSKDISFITSRSYRTVENMRYNIRKKIDLPKETSLTQFILSL